MRKSAYAKYTNVVLKPRHRLRKDNDGASRMNAGMYIIEHLTSTVTNRIRFVCIFCPWYVSDLEVLVHPG
jgi:hypothetical protein